jgi:ABC-type sugar transport system permease subunit
MLLWLIGLYLSLLLLLVGCAGYVALFVNDDKRRRQAFRVLRLVLAATTSLVAATVYRLYHTGLLG